MPHLGHAVRYWLQRTRAAAKTVDIDGLGSVGLMGVESGLVCLAMIRASDVESSTHGVATVRGASPGESLTHVRAFAAVGLESGCDADRSAGRREPAHLSRRCLPEEGANSLGLPESLHGWLIRCRNSRERSSRVKTTQLAMRSSCVDALQGKLERKSRRGEGGHDRTYTEKRVQEDIGAEKESRLV